MFIHKGEGNYEQIDDESFFNSHSKGSDRILTIDFDGVWVSVDEYRAQLFKEAGYDLDTSNTSRDMALAAGVPFDEYMDVSVKSCLGIMEHGTLEGGLHEYWPKIRDIPNLKIYVVTSRYDHMMDVLLEFIKKQKTYVDGVFNVNNKPKKEVLGRLQPDTFVDDATSKIYQLFEDPEKCTKIIPGLKNCDFVFFRNKGCMKKDITVKGKVMDLHGGWDKLYEYARNKFND